MGTSFFDAKLSTYLPKYLDLDHYYFTYQKVKNKCISEVLQTWFCSRSDTVNVVQRMHDTKVVGQLLFRYFQIKVIIIV